MIMQQVCKFCNGEIQSGGDHDRYFNSSNHYIDVEFGLFTFFMLILVTADNFNKYMIYH